MDVWSLPLPPAVAAPLVAVVVTAIRPAVVNALATVIFARSFASGTAGGAPPRTPGAVNGGRLCLPSRRG
eukprot:6843555-Pyramimonas_sp.AAC.1